MGYFNNGIISGMKSRILCRIVALPVLLFLSLMTVSLYAQGRTQGLSIQSGYGGKFFIALDEACKEKDFICSPNSQTMQKFGITIGKWEQKKAKGIEIVYYYNSDKINNPDNLAGLEFSEIWQLSYITSSNWVETRILKSPVEFALNGHFAPGLYYYRGIEPNSESTGPPTKKIRWYTVGIDLGIELRLGFSSGSSKIMTYFEPVNVSLTTRTLAMGIKGGLAIRF